VTGPARPPSFHGEHVWDWCDWVLEHGLPGLPPELREGEAAPVAYAELGEWAAVMTLAYDPECPPELDMTVQTYRWSAGSWAAANGDGGSNWHPGTRLGRPTWLGARQVVADHRGRYGEDGWLCAEIDGVAGVDAATVEVEQAGRRHRHPIDSPVGAWLAVFDGAAAATVRVLDGSGDVLFEHEVAAGP